jgi:hypothetical protein
VVLFSSPSFLADDDCVFALLCWSKGTCSSFVGHLNAECSYAMGLLHRRIGFGVAIGLLSVVSCQGQLRGHYAASGLTPPRIHPGP